MSEFGAKAAPVTQYVQMDDGSVKAIKVIGHGRPAVAGQAPASASPVRPPASEAVDKQQSGK